MFQGFIDTRTIPNLLLTGSSGVGKTTVAQSLVSQIGWDSMVINASLHKDIGILKTTISEYASTYSMGFDRKCVILDEADYLNPQSTQPALRRFMEEFSYNCGFILTCNYPKKIIDPLQSRCSVIDFTYDSNEKLQVAKEFINRLVGILEERGVSYDRGVIAELLMKHLPDWRRIYNEIQRYS
jgi:DNA polymerase III delta prime subunit